MKKTVSRAKRREALKRFAKGEVTLESITHKEGELVWRFKLNKGVGSGKQSGFNK